MISDDLNVYRELLTGELEIPTRYEEDNIKHDIIRTNNLFPIKICKLLFILLINTSSSCLRFSKTCFFSKYEISPLCPDKRLKKKYKIKNVETNKK